MRDYLRLWTEVLRRCSETIFPAVVPAGTQSSIRVVTVEHDGSDNRGEYTHAAEEDALGVLLIVARAQKKGEAVSFRLGSCDRGGRQRAVVAGSGYRQAEEWQVRTAQQGRRMVVLVVWSAAEGGRGGVQVQVVALSERLARVTIFLIRRSRTYGLRPTQNLIVTTVTIIFEHMQAISTSPRSVTANYLFRPRLSYTRLTSARHY